MNNILELKRRIFTTMSNIKRLSVEINDNLETLSNAEILDLETKLLVIKNYNNINSLAQIDKLVPQSNLINITDELKLTTLLTALEGIESNLIKIENKISASNDFKLILRDSNITNVKDFIKNIHKAELEKSISKNAIPTKCNISITTLCDFNPYLDVALEILNKLYINSKWQLNLGSSVNAIIDPIKCNILINAEIISKTDISKTLEQIESQIVNNSIVEINNNDSQKTQISVSINFDTSAQFNDIETFSFEVKSKGVLSKGYLEFATFDEKIIVIDNYNITESNVSFECHSFQLIITESKNIFDGDICFASDINLLNIEIGSNQEIEEIFWLESNDSLIYEITNKNIQNLNVSVVSGKYQYLNDVDPLTMDNIKEQTIDCFILKEIIN